MHKFVTAIFMCFSFLAAPVFAGPGHDHEHEHSHGPVSSDVAGNKAVKKVQQLAKAGKIDASWAEIKPSSVEKKTYAKGPEWVIIFENENVQDVSKQKLYLFYSLDGHYIAANYTGE